MWQKQDKHLNLLDMHQKVKLYILIGILSIGVSTICTSCSSGKISETPIDKVEISSSHYIRGDVEKTFEDEESIKKYVTFFDELELRDIQKDERVSELDGGGWDYITFKNQDKIVKQYVLYGNFICEDVDSVKDALKMENFKERCEKLDSLKWKVISNENSTQWQAYIQELIE